MECTCSYNYLRHLGFPETAIRHSVVCRVRNEATESPERKKEAETVQAKLTPLERLRGAQNAKNAPL